MKLTYLAVAALVFAVACTRADETPQDTALVDIGGGTPLPAGGTPAPAADTAARTVHVVLNEWRVAPAQTTLAPGRVTFHVMNEGQNQHALEVERGGQEWETQRIAPGGTATLTVDLTPGTYTLYCPVEDAQGNHRQRGMQTTITVQ